MPKRTSRLELMSTQYLTDVTTKNLAKLLKTTPNKVHKYIRGEAGAMTRDDEMVLLSQVKDALYRKALGYYVDELEITTHYDKRGLPVDDRKSGYHSTVKITRKYIKPEIQAQQTVIEKFEPGFLNSTSQEVVQFIDDIKELEDAD